MLGMCFCAMARRSASILALEVIGLPFQSELHRCSGDTFALSTALIKSIST